ncbi:hypothetical protein Zmor_007676 [Zophobas morio]|uniref:Odorant receptor n=1 Tax=Zophobas morio TaxID=2755281 RepID=A0AA38MMA3_9CUCU|nr:hypothetical protein Zmor_007676 [Zophobas morio]
MEKFEWKDAIKTNIRMLKLAGLWPPGDDSYKLNLYTLYATISLTFFVIIFNLSLTLNIFTVLDDLKAIASILFASITLTIAVLKSYYLTRNMKLLKELMVTINSDLFQPKSPTQRELVEFTLNPWKKAYKMYNSMTMAAFCAWSVAPLTDGSIANHELPFPAWFPYNYKPSPFYEITFLYQFISMGVTSFINVNIDTLIAALNVYVGAQCQILCDDLRTVDLSQQLRGCIKHHKAILTFAEKSNKFFNWIVFVQFFTSVLSIAMAMFQMTMDVPFTTDFFARVFYVTAITIQIFVYCWFGNEVTLQSGNIPSATFESNWIGKPLEVRKSLVLIILRSQKPIKMSALNLFYLSLDTFMTIMRSSYSYFAILQQLT